MYFFILGTYFIALIGIGLFLSKKNKHFDSFFFANRRVGSLLLFFTVSASWIGAASTIATIQEGTKTGFRALWLLCIPTLLTLVAFVFLNKKIRTSHFVSLPHMLQKKYGKTVTYLASLLIFLYMILLAASQLVAWGKFMSFFFQQNYDITIFLGAFIIIIYSYFGGYFSVIVTDALQFFLLCSAVLFMFFYFNIRQPAISPGPKGHFFEGLTKNTLITLSFTMAWIISPIIWQRIASARDIRTSRRSLIGSIMAILVFYLVVISIALRMGSGYPGQQLGQIVVGTIPPAGSLLIFIGIAAAIMSTADTAINISALTVIKDICSIKDKNNLLYSRLAVLFSGILAVLIALRFNSIITTLGVASEIMAEGLFIPGMYALFFKKAKPRAGLFSLVLGGGFATLTFLKTFGLYLPTPSWPHSLPIGLLLSLSGFILGYVLDTFSSGKHPPVENSKDQ